VASRSLPDRPLISTPARLHARAFLDAERRRLALQPGLGLAGLLLVVPVAALLAVGAGGAEPSVLVFAPLVTFALPVVAMIAFWWEDWPGSRLRPGWSGLLDTIVVAIAAVGLTMLGQVVVGGLDMRAIFDPTPGPGHSPTFPATMPLAGAAFVAMLQLTLVCEGWPLRRLPAFAAGIAALAVSWVMALVLYATGVESGALLVLIGAWQVWFFVAWRGWPFADMQRRWVRLVAGNATVIGGAWVTYAALHGAAGVAAATIVAAAGSFIAAALVVGMLFEAALLSRVATMASIVLLAAGLYLVLGAYADSVHWTRASRDDWVGHVGLNAIGVAVILHVAIGRRWPFGADEETPPSTRSDTAMPDALPSPVSRAIDAANGGDTDAFLACFTADGVVDDWGREFHGPSEVTGWSDKEFIGVHVSLTVDAVETAGPDTTVTAQVGGDGFNGPSHFTFRVDGDRVSRMTIRA
jgi:hypothetical protein